MTFAEKKLGRPQKYIDTGVMLHMMRNGCPVKVAAKIMGIHRDTLYARYRDVIQAGRHAWQQFWMDNVESWLKPQREAHKAEVVRKRVARWCGAPTRRNTACRLPRINGGPCFHHGGIPYRNTNEPTFYDLVLELPLAARQEIAELINGAGDTHQKNTSD